MVVFPMLGKSSRFFEAGYKVPKYELPLNGGSTVFEESVKSLAAFFDEEPFIFVVRSDYGAAKFVRAKAEKLGISDFKILEHNGVTSGQAESVFLGVADMPINERLWVFNIDTILKNFKPIDFDCDGLLDVFEGEGERWSFVMPGERGRVIKTTEKVRVSNLCSNGLYYFDTLELYRDAYLYSDHDAFGESYIAPIYNFMIKRGCDIRYRVVNASETIHCGTPSEYQALVEEN